MSAAIRDIKVFYPEKVLTNDELRTNHPDWNLDLVGEKIGVTQRYIAGDGETALDLGFAATQELFRSHPRLRDQVDALIFCTQSQDYILPPNACLLHGRLELHDQVTAFDINHACSGFVYALSLANSLIRSQAARNVVVVTSDTYSKYINQKDRSARVLFGDGAAATWFSVTDEESGIRDVTCCTDGTLFDKFIIPAGGCRLPKSSETAKEQTDESGNVRCQENIHMAGRDILTFVNSKIPRHVRDVLAKQKLTTQDIDLFVFHQASATVLDCLARLLKLDDKQVFRNLSSIGNTVSASIPIALHDAQQSKRLSRGDQVLLCGFGVGLSWGSALLTW